jgi:hypothetical protein
MSDREEQYRVFRERTLQPGQRGFEGGERACEALFEFYMANRAVNWGCPDLTRPREERRAS